MLRGYNGGCHCRAIRFEADIDLALGTTKCNCTLCTKMRLWAVKVPLSQFRLLAGENATTDYRGTNPVAHHLFCKHCGVHAYEWVDAPNLSGAPYININVLCLDGLDVEELLAAPVTYADGLHNAWSAHPAEVRHL